MDANHLIRRFAEARLPLSLASTPLFGRGAESIFQMDIRRTEPRNARSEYYIAWPGMSDTLAVVQGLDPRLRQLVLMVREPERTFFEPVPAWQLRTLRKDPRGLGPAIAERARVALDDVVVQRDLVAVRRTTPAEKRHLLVGRDERQLFLCRLPSACTSVRQAHQALRPLLPPEPRSAIYRTIRQGEWFFVALTEKGVDEVDGELAAGRASLHCKAAIGAFIPRPGKAHVVDELAVLQVDGEQRVYARGAVRHDDHFTIWIDRWRRVLRNREVDAGRSLFGGTWVD